MRKVILILFFPFLALAQDKIAKTDFWQARYTENVELALRPLTKGLAKDCKAFQDTAAGLNAEDFANARTLPLAGQMLDHYLGLFEVSDGRSLAASDPATVVNAEVSVLPQTLTGIFVKEPGALVKMAAQLGLPPASFRLYAVEGSVRPRLEISGRDLACDILSKSLSLGATAQYQVAIPAEDILRLNKFYTRVEGITLSVLSDSNLPWRRAVALGYRLGQLYDRQKQSEDEVRESLQGILHVLFNPGTFDPGENWQSFGDDRFITYPKSVLAGPGPVLLKM